MRRLLRAGSPCSPHVPSSTSVSPAGRHALLVDNDDDMLERFTTSSHCTSRAWVLTGPYGTSAGRHRPFFIDRATSSRVQPASNCSWCQDGCPSEEKDSANPPERILIFLESRAFSILMSITGAVEHLSPFAIEPGPGPSFASGPLAYGPGLRLRE